MVACNETGSSTYVLVCEHASNYIPREYGGLGLPPQDLERHIAWDIGAAALAQQLSSLLDAPLFVSGYSRLLIDCNRPPLAPTSIPVRSEATEIPGNRDLDEAERERRAAAYFWPFQTRIARALDERAAAGRPTALLGIHSFTPIFLGVQRPWHVGVLYARAAAFSQALIAQLAADRALVVGDNQPYRVTEEEDYTVPVHGDARGIDAAGIEVRQDLLATTTSKGVAEWASRLAAALSDLQPGARAG
ncbi:MAG: N-formylglutamate amidohydrolase [Acetobacteraceae bacterium]|nr:N-formylglutamate amidohydrolase [Acetobacteraceae bacterium]